MQLSNIADLQLNFISRSSPFNTTYYQQLVCSDIIYFLAKWMYQPTDVSSNTYLHRFFVVTEMKCAVCNPLIFLCASFTRMLVKLQARRGYSNRFTKTLHYRSSCLNKYVINMQHDPPQEMLSLLYNLSSLVNLPALASAFVYLSLLLEWFEQRAQ